jgi:hypothetical protein
MKKFFALFITFIMALSFLTTPSQTYAVQQVNQLAASQIPDHIILTWQGDPKTTQTISWRTDTTITKSIVQYTKEADFSSFPEKSLSVEGKTEKLSSDLGDMSLHTVLLTNLQQGTKYIYRVGDGIHWSNTSTFTTEPENITSFKFLIFTDNHSGKNPNKPELWKNTIQNAFKSNPDSKFLVDIGDIVEWGNHFSDWNDFFDGAEGVVDKIPAMVVMGNHELYNFPNKKPYLKPNFFVSQFNLPQNGPEGLKGQVYSFDYGDAHIIVLDSQAEEEKDYNKDLLNKEKIWLENDLKNTNKKWKIAFFHKPPYFIESTESQEDIRQAFSPIFDKYHIDVVFNGHHHGIARTYPIYNDSLVTSPSKGTIYYVAGRSGEKVPSGLSSKVWDAFFYDPQDQPNYIVADINNNKMVIKVLKQDGTLIDSYSIDKSSNTDEPKTILPPKYSTTQLVLFGDRLHEPFISSNPKQINNKWYVPIRPFIQYLGGSVDWHENGNIDLSYNNNNVKVDLNSKNAIENSSTVSLPDSLIIDNQYTYISAEDLKTLFGFSYKYDANTNMLMFTK